MPQFEILWLSLILGTFLAYAMRGRQPSPRSWTRRVVVRGAPNITASA
jgi:hypothetical protein